MDYALPRPIQLQTDMVQVYHVVAPQLISERIQNGKSWLKEGKAANPHEIPPEVMSWCNLDEIMLDFANKLLQNQESPDQWSWD